MEIEREAMRKTSVQDFQWDGTEPRIDGKHVWFRSIDGSEHGWPQHTEFEAMRLAMFLHGAIAAALTAERDRHNTIAKNDAEDGIAAGRISHDEARQMLSRFINSHFNNPGEKARASIPARPKYDDDLRMIAYINQQRERDAKFAAFADENGEPRKVLGTLPVLASGEIVTAETHPVFAIDATHGIVECDVEFSGDRVTAGWMKAGTDANTWTEYDIGDCYSTKQAAEAAAGKHTATYRKTTDGDHSIQTEQAP